MKKTIFVSCFLLFQLCSFADPIEKVKQAFQTVFPSAENVRWYEGDGYVEAVFDERDKKHRVKYASNGTVISARSDYYGKDLCPFLKAKVANRFPKQKVYGVTELQSQEELSYRLILEDDKQWIHVDANVNGEMTVVEQYKKA
jgi:hypothetical protein